MDWTIILIECILMLIAFTCMIMIPLIKNPEWWIADYPEEIQERYFETHERVPTAFTSSTVLIKKGCATILATAILIGLALWAGADSFGSALLLTYGLWMVVDWYDCFFLDWVLFANMKSVRLPGTEDMDEAYHNKKYHFVQSLYGMLIGFIPSLLCAVVIAIIK